VARNPHRTGAAPEPEPAAGTRNPAWAGRPRRGTPAAPPNPSPGRDGEARIFPRARTRAYEGGEGSSLSPSWRRGRGPARVLGARARRGVRVGGGGLGFRGGGAHSSFLWRPRGFRGREATCCCGCGILGARKGKRGLLAFLLGSRAEPAAAGWSGLACACPVRCRRLEPSREV
jgi:hypothetical protein